MSLHNHTDKLELQISDLVKDNEALHERIRKLEAQLWVAKDSQLRTYDGLTQKADTVDKLLPIMAELLDYLDWLKLDTANDLYSQTISKLRDIDVKMKEVKK